MQLGKVVRRLRGERTCVIQEPHAAHEQVELTNRRWERCEGRSGRKQLLVCGYAACGVGKRVAQAREVCQ